MRGFDEWHRYTMRPVTYWVDAINGSDDNDGLTPGTAFRTQAAATRRHVFSEHGHPVRVGHVGDEGAKP